MDNKIKQYQALVFKWQKSINLISTKEKDFFVRHISDSLQLKKFLGSAEVLIDLGSGAGLPGIPLAISTGLITYLIESDRRKAIFLAEAVRELKLNVKVINQRIEQTKIGDFSDKNIVITARALAPLDKLLSLVHSFLENNSSKSYKLILPKGEKVLQEIEKAQKAWIFEHFLKKSETDETAWILIIKNLSQT